MATRWFCEAHRLWTGTDCPKCDDELIALTEGGGEHMTGFVVIEVSTFEESDVPALIERIRQDKDVLTVNRIDQ